MMENEVMVSVLCTAYNHEKYIRTCLESLVNQVTNFRYEIIINDDASTDSTAEIIREYERKYSDKVIAIYQEENLYSKHIGIMVNVMLPAARGKYIALCEGDDFWLDNYKLQKQFDFMEKHTECSICGHAAYYAKENGELIHDRFFRPYQCSKEVPYEEILSSWKMATNSLFYRRTLRGTGKIPYAGDCRNGDYILMTYLGLQGSVYYFDEFMSAYREISQGSIGWVWRNDLKKYKSDRLKFIDMLRRLDVYTEQKYHETIETFRENNYFELYCTVGELPKAKEYSNQYSQLPLNTKIKLHIKYYCPFLIKVVRKIKRQI